MTVRPCVCQRHNIRDEHWWSCFYCVQVWNERNTGGNWRPHECPERPGEENHMMTEAYRHPENHDR